MCPQGVLNNIKSDFNSISPLLIWNPTVLMFSNEEMASRYSFHFFSLDWCSSFAFVASTRKRKYRNNIGFEFEIVALLLFISVRLESNFKLSHTISKRMLTMYHCLILTQQILKSLLTVEVWGLHQVNIFKKKKYFIFGFIQSLKKRRSGKFST